jgi:putative ABC transport system permease protein
MFRNFLRIAIRYLYRNKTYSILNFLCLTFGLTCAIIAVLFIRNVFSHDKFHNNYENLYSVNAWVTYFNGDRFPKEYLSASLDNVLKEQVPEIEKMTRITNRSYTFVIGNKSFTENGIYADNNFFDLFTFPIVNGDTRNALSENNSILISERMAKKFFENTDCIGKTLILKDEGKQDAFKISGILKNVPSTSYLQFDFVIPFSTFLANNGWANETGATANQIWVQLKPNAARNFVDNKIKNLIKSQETTLNQDLFLFPLKEKLIYTYAGGKRVWDEMQNVVIVGCIGFAILLIACFNFINMAIALNIRRYREAGIKKVVGSRKSTITIQFLGETFILTLISLFTAIVISKLLLNGFNTIFGQDIHFQLSDFKIILIFIAITLFTGLLSGLFPALYLASSSPISVLKGKIVTSHSYSFFRQSLIVFQFTIPIVLIICMMIIKTQDKFMRNFDIGVDKDNIIVLDNTKNIQEHAESFKAELLSIPAIDAVSFTNCIPTRGTRPTNDVDWEGKDASEKLHFWCVNTDFDYNKTVDVNIIDGRFLNKSFSSDSTNYLINDVAAKVMKYEKPIGKTLTIEGKKGTIVGVFKDFHAIDLAGPLVPTIIRIKPDDRPTLLIKFSSGNYPSIAAKINDIYKKYEAESPFQARLFRDTEFSELRMPSNLIGLAFFIALMLACFGFFGLASFTTESRTKEIGIRKVNGATNRTVISMLLKNYSKWLTFAFFISLPIAFLLGKFILGRFFFHTAMPYWAFIAGPVIAYLIAILTVSLQSYRAAKKNPVEALRYE